MGAFRIHKKLVAYQPSLSRNDQNVLLSRRHNARPQLRRHNSLNLSLKNLFSLIFLKIKKDAFLLVPSI